MREVLDRTELHGMFMQELRRHPDGAKGEFVFEINHRPEGVGGCNWYPLAAIELWRGDLMRNLAAFRDVRDQLATRYNLRAPADAAMDDLMVEEPAPA
jgi:hypothetical protein